MPSSLKAGKVPFTPASVDAIRLLPFEQKPIGLDEGGRLLTQAVDDSVRDYFIRDAKTSGFALRRFRSNKQEFKATWYCERKVAGRVCRYICGDFSVSLAAARRTAEIALAKMKIGIDPNHEVEENKRKVELRDSQKRLTFLFMMERDAERRSSENAAIGKSDTANTARDRRNTIKVVKGQPIAGKPVADLNTDDLLLLIQGVRKKHGDSTAIKVWRYARAAFARLPSYETPQVHLFDEFLKSNDAALPRPKRSNRYLPTGDQTGVKWLEFIAAQRNELTAVKTGHPWTRGVMADAIITTLCLGFRKMEALALKVEDVSFEKRWIRITEERAKNKRVHYVPLCPGMEMLLRERIEKNARPRGRDVEQARRGASIPVSEYLFPTERRTAKCGHIVAVQSLLDLASEHSQTYVSMHDLRRTFGGEIYSLIVGGDTLGTGGDTRLVKQALNHIAEEDSEITMSYVNVEARVNALRPSAEAHERKIFAICGIAIPEAIKEVPANDAEALLEALKQRVASDPSVLESLRAMMVGTKTEGTF